MGQVLHWELRGAGSGRVPKGGVERLGLERWEDSDLRIKGSRSKRSPRSRGGEEGVLGRQEACLGEVVGCRGGRGGGQGASRPRVRWGHRDTGPRSPSPRQAHPWLCAQLAVFLRMCAYF